MLYVGIGVIAFLLGAAGTFVVLDGWRRKLAALKLSVDRKSVELEAGQRALATREQEVYRDHAAGQAELAKREAQLKADRKSFDDRVISYDELRNENGMLKRDLQGVDVHMRKLQLDHEAREQAQIALNERSNELAARFLKDSVLWISSSLTANNFSASKQRLQNVIEWCRKVGYSIPPEQEQQLLGNLKAEYEKVVRAAMEREEQARIKAQIREEQRLEREAEREKEKAERDKALIEAALAKALAESSQQHTQEIEILKARLAEAEERSQRAVSQAQLTKCGHVYVISNIGSFGQDVFKIGMTRRLEPLDRVYELGDASVPFPFDIHMMISCDDAPSLENELHRRLHKLRINKANPRKEFFKVNLDIVRQIVVEHHGEVQYVADPEALEYRQSLTMTDEDEEFIEQVYEKLEADGAETHADE